MRISDYSSNGGSNHIFLPTTMTIPLVLLALLAGGAHAESQVPLTTAPTDIWTALSTRFGDRVFKAAPFAQPCFANATSAECASIQVCALVALPSPSNSSG
jgi:hypothetical protein